MSGKRTILMISDHSDPLAVLGGEEAGGQNVYVDALSSRLAQKGHTVHVLTRQNKPQHKLREKSPTGYTVCRVPLGPPGFLPKEEFGRYIPALTAAAEQLAQKHRYDVIHSHYWLSGMVGIALQQRMGTPLVHTFHSLGKVKHATLRGIDPTQKKEREEGEMRIVESADCLLAESLDERRNLLHLYQADAERITVVPAGVDTNLFYPESKELARKRLGIRHKHVILYVGRFVAQKGLPTLLQAYAQLLDGLSTVEAKQTMLLLVGGSLQATEKQSRIQRRVQSLIVGLHLENNVRVVGQVENEELPPYYQAADFCVVPSRYEPFGIVPLEAMACGTPVVASFVGGMKSTVRNLHTGLHARPNVSADFAYKMRILFKNPALRSDLGTQAREHVEREYAWPTVCDRILSCYNSTIAHGSNHS